MKKLLLASASAIAVLGLAACSDTDGTTTQSIDEPVVQQPVEPGLAPVDPAAPPADQNLGTDDTTTQSIDEPTAEEPSDELDMAPADGNGEAPAEDLVPAE